MDQVPCLASTLQALGGDLTYGVNQEAWVTHTCNPSTQDVKPGESKVQSHPWLHREFKGAGGLAVTSSPGDPMPSSGLQGTCTYICINTHACTNLKNFNLKK